MKVNIITLLFTNTYKQIPEKNSLSESHQVVTEQTWSCSLLLTNDSTATKAVVN